MKLITRPSSVSRFFVLLTLVKFRLISMFMLNLREG